uniref:Uncharacterized protein n=1 Tax=Sphaerodactylus townsendi TaxID=933632 RepID=A0ACB8EL09_9SAUR
MFRGLLPHGDPATIWTAGSLYCFREHPHDAKLNITCVAPLFPTLKKNLIKPNRLGKAPSSCEYPCVLGFPAGFFFNPLRGFFFLAQLQCLHCGSAGKEGTPPPPQMFVMSALLYPHNIGEGGVLQWPGMPFLTHPQPHVEEASISGDAHKSRKL